MTNERMARGYIKDAREKFESLIYFLKRERFNIVVREAQECVELSLKAALRYVGVESAKSHDVSELLLREERRFPGFFREKLERLAEISRVLTMERGRSFYGDEERGIPPSELYSKDDAEEAIGKADFALKLSERLIGGS